MLWFCRLWNSDEFQKLTNAKWKKFNMAKKSDNSTGKLVTVSIVGLSGKLFLLWFCSVHNQYLHSQSLTSVRTKDDVKMTLVTTSILIKEAEEFVCLNKLMPGS